MGSWFPFSPIPVWHFPFPFPNYTIPIPTGFPWENRKREFALPMLAETDSLRLLTASETATVSVLRAGFSSEWWSWWHRIICMQTYQHQHQYQSSICSTAGATVWTGACPTIQKWGQGYNKNLKHRTGKHFIRALFFNELVKNSSCIA